MKPGFPLDVWLNINSFLELDDDISPILDLTLSDDRDIQFICLRERVRRVLDNLTQVLKKFKF
jgi:hypothetical protein